jgi:hypothetical protein
MMVDSASQVQAKAITPPVHYQVDRLDSLQGDMDLLLASLTEKLSEVLGPDSPVEQIEAPVGAGQGYSSLANSLSNNVYRAETMNGRIESLIGRLEV